MANYSLIIMCSIIGTPNNHHFPFGTNGKVVVLGVPILKHNAEIPPKSADRTANSTDPNQTAPFGVIWKSICPNVLIFRIITCTKPS